MVYAPINGRQQNRQMNGLRMLIVCSYIIYAMFIFSWYNKRKPKKEYTDYEKT